MATSTKPLFEMTAEELMSRDVAAIPRRMSLRAAAHLLNESRISGAPVVDETGRCVGVLTTSDLSKWVERGERASKRPHDSAVCMCTDWQVPDVSALPADEVSRYMTTDLVTASPHADITELARSMLDADIHRVLITDKQGRPVGIVTSTDILAAVANAEGQRERFHNEEGCV
jgi:predicted transcriptional regulator